MKNPASHFKLPDIPSPGPLSVSPTSVHNTSSGSDSPDSAEEAFTVLWKPEDDSQPNGDINPMCKSSVDGLVTGKCRSKCQGQQEGGQGQQEAGVRVQTPDSGLAGVHSDAPFVMVSDISAQLDSLADPEGKEVMTSEDAGCSRREVSQLKSPEASYKTHRYRASSDSGFSDLHCQGNSNCNGSSVHIKNELGASYLSIQPTCKGDAECEEETMSPFLTPRESTSPQFGFVENYYSNPSEGMENNACTCPVTSPTLSKPSGAQSHDPMCSFLDQIKEGANDMDVATVAIGPDSNTPDPSISKSDMTLNLSSASRKRKTLSKYPSMPSFHQTTPGMSPRSLSPTSPAPGLNAGSHNPESNPVTPTYAKVRHFAQSPVQYFRHLPIAKNPYMSPFLASDELLRDMCPVYFMVSICKHWKTCLLCIHFVHSNLDVLYVLLKYFCCVVMAYKLAFM